MKRVALIIVLALLSGCASYSYPIKDGGDGVYYAESPPVYTYVGGYYGFSYYGPYSGYWYHPIWYSPVMGPHYSWYRPFQYCGISYYGPSRYCGMPYYGPSRMLVSSNAVGEGNGGKARTPVSTAPLSYPIMPVGLEQMTITSSPSRSSSKNPAFASAGMKSRYSAKSAKSGKSTRRSSVDSYRPSASYRNSSSRRSPSISSRSQTVRYPASRIIEHDEN